MIVAKFGGSSVKDGEAMLRSSSIIEDNSELQLVIISATYNTTNQLEMVAKASWSGDQEMLKRILEEIKSKHATLAHQLFSSAHCMDELKKLQNELEEKAHFLLEKQSVSDREMDFIYSFGERMSSLIFYDLLKMRLPERNVLFFDMRDVLKTNSDYKKAAPEWGLIELNAKKFLTPLFADSKTLVVSQGFIGSDLMGHTTTLGREGSDYSATILGEALNAQLVQIWTDVSGVLTTDPRKILKAKKIDELSYDEATALATLGAKVLFPRTLIPTARKKIPVYVGSSLRPDLGGTLITSHLTEELKLKAVTLRESEDEKIISVIGSHLSKNSRLPDLLLEKCGNKKEHFSFFDFTDVSISYRFYNLKGQEALELFHSFL